MPVLPEHFCFQSSMAALPKVAPRRTEALWFSKVSGEQEDQLAQEEDEWAARLLGVARAGSDRKPVGDPNVETDAEGDDADDADLEPDSDDLNSDM